MRVKTFLFVCKEFFDQIHPNYIDDEEEIDEFDIENNKNEEEEMKADIIRDIEYFSDIFNNIFFFMNFKPFNISNAD